MQQCDDNNPPSSDSPTTTLLVFGFVLVILLYLVAIDRPDWFHIRPFSGGAMAMSNAATPAKEPAGSHAAGGVRAVTAQAVR